MSNRLKQPLTEIGQFYKQIDDFKSKIILILQQLKGQNLTDPEGNPIDIDHEIKEIHKYYDKLVLAKKANIRMPIEMLYEYGVCPYADKILLRDEQFFLGQVKDIANNKELTEAYELEHKDLLFIGQVRMIWEYLDQNTQSGQQVKTNIWNYVQVICLLAEKIMKQNILATARQQLTTTGQLK